MADMQYEYRIVEEPPKLRASKTRRTIWFRSTNYMPSSGYGWHTLSTTYPASEKELVAAVKQLWQMDQCELIPARPETIETMLTEG